MRRTDRALGARGVLPFLAVMLLVASITAAGAVGATPGPGQDRHYFLMTVKSSGEYSADYGDERLTPGLTTSFGVDGTETGSWSWKIRAVGRSVGGGPLRSAAAEFKGSASHDASLINYTIQMGELGEDDLCRDSAWRRKIITYSMPSGESGPAPGTRPLWISSPDTSIEYRQGGFAVGYPSRYGLVQHCYHGLPRRLQLYSLILPTETPVPSGEFNPRSDRSFSGSWQDGVNEFEGLGEPQEHRDRGSAELEIEIEAISEEKARKKRDSYREPDPQDGLYTTD